MYDTITNYNDRNHTPLSNVNIREAINKVILEGKSEANNVTVDTFSPMRNYSENLIKKVENLIINDAGNDLIDNVMNMKINGTGKNMIGCVANKTINETRNDIDRSNMSDVQVQFASDPAGKTHQNLLSIQKIRIRQEEVPVLDPLIETNIVADNQKALKTSTGIVQAPKAIKTPKMEESITVMTAYNTGANRNPRRVIWTGVDDSTPVTSGTRAIDGSTPVSGGSISSAVFTISPPPSIIWKGSIGNIRKTTTPNFKKPSELNAPVDRTLTSYYISQSPRSKILRDEFSDSSSRDIYLICRMNVTTESVQSMGPQFVSHELPTIDTLDENTGIWIPTTRIRRTPNITHGSASENYVGQVTAVGDEVTDYKKENYKTDF